MHHQRSSAQRDARNGRWYGQYLGLSEAAALAASEAKKAASPVSLPDPDLQSLGSPTLQICHSASLVTAEMSAANVTSYGTRITDVSDVAYHESWHPVKVAPFPLLSEAAVMCIQLTLWQYMGTYVLIVAQTNGHADFTWTIPASGMTTMLASHIHTRYTKPCCTMLVMVKNGAFCQQPLSNTLCWRDRTCPVYVCPTRAGHYCHCRFSTYHSNAKSNIYLKDTSQTQTSMQHDTVTEIMADNASIP